MRMCASDVETVLTGALQDCQGIETAAYMMHLFTLSDRPSTLTGPSPRRSPRLNWIASLQNASLILL